MVLWFVLSVIFIIKFLKQKIVSVFLRGLIVPAWWIHVFLKMWIIYHFLVNYFIKNELLWLDHSAKKDNDTMAN